MNAISANTQNEHGISLRLGRLLLAAAACWSAAATSPAQDGWGVSADPASNTAQAAWGDMVWQTSYEQPPASGEPLVHGEVIVGDEPWDPTAFGPDCGYSCSSAWRVDAGIVWLNREGTENFTLSSGSFVPDHDYEEGIRFTLSRHFDCLDAYEVTYLGPFEWTSTTSVSGSGLAFFVPAAGGVTVDSFNNATFHSQLYESRFNGVELNRKWVGWDVVTHTLGLRYFNVEETYLFSSTSAAGDGLFSILSDSHAIGLQYGFEMLYPLGRWKTSSWMKGGVFGNFVDTSTALTDAGAVQFANSDDDLDFSSLVELGISVSVRVLPNVSVRGGYEAWWLYGLAVASEQLGGALTPTTGRRIDDNGDLWYHGGTASVEVVW